LPLFFAVSRDLDPRHFVGETAVRGMTSTAAGSTVVNLPENASLGAFFNANDEPPWDRSLVGRGDVTTCACNAQRGGELARWAGGAAEQVGAVEPGTLPRFADVSATEHA
jgi:hypothetical protein